MSICRCRQVMVYGCSRSSEMGGIAHVAGRVLQVSTATSRGALGSDSKPRDSALLMSIKASIGFVFIIMATSKSVQIQ
ncbi:hypothetical protein HK44_006875 [Pseudomonas fluorescens HK44]|uniref:Uncharacterized protein n=1 Tax=Pseudomonas fluorescens HK44 TaxID=1042209 RepID=A0A010RZF4_PSEFL|nr:hypothetical protein HK44_006875 [Pseudomonas fluorescens HK44]